MVSEQGGREVLTQAPERGSGSRGARAGRSKSGLSLDRDSGSSLGRKARAGEGVAGPDVWVGVDWLQNFVVVRAAYRDGGLVRARWPSPCMCWEARVHPGHASEGSPCSTRWLGGGHGV